MIKYPIQFEVSAQANSGLSTPWSATALGHKTVCSIPPEFEGPGGALSPEDLFAHALTNCFIATFKVYAEHSKLVFDDLTAKSKLIVDLNESKKPVMKRLELTVNLKNPNNPERAKILAKKAFESGFILNSVKTELDFNFNVVP